MLYQNTQETPVVWQNNPILKDTDIQSRYPIRMYTSDVNILYQHSKTMRKTSK